MEQPAHDRTEASSNISGRQSAFGYICNACSRCCYQKKIQVNPFEAASLAAHLGIDNARFLHDFTMDGGGIYLAQDEAGGCIFLGGQGCTVHSARPLVCRLYPLGRTRHADGSEEWSLLASHPQSAGQFDGVGTIADYLAGQQALELMRIADAYVDWVNHARTRLVALQFNGTSTAISDSSLFNLDDCVSKYCAHSEVAAPTSLEERWRLHIHILDLELEKLEGEL